MATGYAGKDESYISHMIHPVNAKHQQDLYAKITTMLDEAGHEAIGKQMHATAHRSAVLDQFPEKLVPTLVVGARQDKVIPAQHMENLATALKTEVNWLESGHMLPLESPDELSLIINAWFARQNLTHEQEVSDTQGLTEEASSKFTI